MMEEHIYNIITYLIVLLAIFVAARKIIAKNFAKKESVSCADGCGGCATGCNLKEEVNLKKKANS
ncbi:MAG: FeoB-associated Cys-rich membrane protein [Salinivirgaceae bacterium]|jgi:hypothetical protein|nr:FeoB-associated Cys-rich membrane protein [Salinivirgaceae bacterium]